MTKVIIRLVIWGLVGFSSAFTVTIVSNEPMKLKQVIPFVIFGPISYIIVGIELLDSCVLNCKGEK